MQCETCSYYIYDEEYDEYVCDVNMDEDDVARLMQSPESSCPYYINGDEYEIVKHQM